MELKLLSEQGQSVTVEASDALFGREYNEPLVHQVATAYLANARAGTRAQKARGEVAKSTRKPWRQKGTGRARAGMASSPLWRGGGKIFPSSPNENFSQKLNRKMYRGAMASILSQLAREGRIAVVETFAVDVPKTKALAQKIKALGFDQTLLITDRFDHNLDLAARNLPHVRVVTAGQADPVSLIQSPNVVMTRGALAQLEEMLV
jgi:large subunit ribosomal protein L4